MATKILEQAKKSEHSILGTRWCGHCQSSRKVGGGTWIISNGGRNKRWKCAECTQRAKDRANRVD